MKNYVVLCCLLACVFKLHSQIQYYGFEDSLSNTHITIDSNYDSGSNWVIGEPEKTLFDTAFYSETAIYTEPNGDYASNDTSVFYLNIIKTDTGTPVLSFWFCVDADSFNDYGMVEASPDHGSTWVNMMSDSSNTNFYGVKWLELDSFYQTVSKSSTGGDNPLTGKVLDWHFIGMEIPHWNDFHPNNDTILFRFSFIADNVQNNKEGWMIDQIEFDSDILDAVDDLVFNQRVKIFPNPGNNKIHLKGDFNFPLQLQMYSLNGQVLLSAQMKNKNESIDTSQLPRGMYFIRIEDGEGKFGFGKWIRE